MAIGAILSKGVLIKGSIAAAGGTGLGVTWWQVYDNVRPKELAEEEGEGFVLSNLTNSSNTDLDDIPYLTFGDSEKYRNMFRDGDCIKKYLPGKINNIAVQETISRKGNNNPFVLDAHSFSGSKINGFDHRENVGFVGTQGCLSINIKYNNNVDAKNKGMVGKMELVAWNDPIKSKNVNVNGYGMIMSSIISNLKGQFKFVNKLTFIKKNEEGNWDVLNSAIWVDTYSKEIGKNIDFKFGENESFSFTTSKENTNKKKLERPQEYKKLARWFLGKKGKNHDKLLGHWNINIGGNNTDLWKDLNSLLKQNKIFSPELYYKDKDKKWYKDSKFKYDFGNFDRWNPAEQAGNHGGDGNNRMSEYGTWIDVLEECVNKKNSSYKNICLTVS